MFVLDPTEVSKEIEIEGATEAFQFCIPGASREGLKPESRLGIPPPHRVK